MDSTAAQPHPLWSVTEMVCAVMGHLHDQHTLAQCARVSRGISDPALQVLWENMGGIDWLPYLLPTSLKLAHTDSRSSVVGNVDKRSNLILVSVLLAKVSLALMLAFQVSCENFRADEWARLQHYARLVRIYHYHGGVENFATAALLEKLQGRALLPCLQRLEWYCPYNHSGSGLFGAFLSPILRTFYVDILGEGEPLRGDNPDIPGAAEYTTGMMLQMLRARSPHVESLRISTKVFPWTIKPLQGFSNLRSLTLWEVANLTLVLDVGSSLPFLQKLELDYVYPDRTPPPLPRSAAAVFPHLVQLGLYNRSGAYGLAFLSCLCAPILKSIWLDYNHTYEAQEEWRSCVKVVASRLGSSLTSFKVVARGSFNLHDSFHPLYTVTTLRNVQVHIKEVSRNTEPPFKIVANDIGKWRPRGQICASLNCWRCRSTGRASLQSPRVRPNWTLRPNTP